MESMSHKETLYVTLTYNGFDIPFNYSLRKTDVTRFLKRLRKSVLPKRFRYYCCGEYGFEKSRPHYHFTLFGIGFEEAENIRQAWRETCYLYGEKVTWSKGFASIGFLTDKSAGYVAGYVCKGLYQDNDYTRSVLNGRAPEFSVMSRNPGLGAYKARDIANRLGNRDVDVSTIRFGKKSWPIGSYIRRIINDERSYKEAEYTNINKYYNSVYDGVTSIDEKIIAATQLEKNNLARLKIYNRRRRS